MLIIAGTFRVARDKLAKARPHLERMVNASVAEDGCITYSYASDLFDPELFRVFEIWRDRAAHAAHDRAPHLAEWKAARGALGFSNRNLTLYESETAVPV
jgi:quinol monooxygenase YgiN